MNQIVLINIEWNSINGCIFKLLTIELNKPNIDSSLFGVNYPPTAKLMGWAS